MNLYRYCGDDPINKSDPSGLKVEVVVEEASDFKTRVEQDIAFCRALDAAYEKAYQEMDKSDEVHVIKPASDPGNTTAKVLADGSKGNSNQPRYKDLLTYLKSFLTNRTGSTTYYDPDNWLTDSLGYRDPRIGFAHEFFGHGLSRNNGTEFWDAQAKNEASAIRSENIAREYIDGSKRSENYYKPEITYP